MQGKITLITPPDYYENSNKSILFMHISDQEQDLISKWFSHSDVKENLNLYVYTNEVNLSWIFYAFGRCDYKYINFDYKNTITQTLGSYFLSRNNVYFSSTDENLVSIYSHLNNNRISRIESFLERILIDQGK